MADAVYSADLDSPVLLEQGRENTLTCPLRRAGSLVEPSSGTISIFNASGVAVVTDQAVDPSSGTATFTTGTFASSTRGMRWRIAWTLTVDGVVRTFRSTAALVLCVPYPTVSDATIAARVPALDSTRPGAITRAASHQTQIEDAWKEVRRRLARAGRRPHLIVDQDDLQEPHLLLAISRIFGGLGVVKPEYLEQEKRYERMFEKAWTDVQFEYDDNDDGTVDDNSRSGGGMLWLCGR